MSNTTYPLCFNKLLSQLFTAIFASIIILICINSTISARAEEAENTNYISTAGISVGIENRSNDSLKLSETKEEVGNNLAIQSDLGNQEAVDKNSDSFAKFLLFILCSFGSIYVGLFVFLVYKEISNSQDIVTVYNTIDDIGLALSDVSKKIIENIIIVTNKLFNFISICLIFFTLIVFLCICFDIVIIMSIILLFILAILYTIDRAVKPLIFLIFEEICYIIKIIIRVILMILVISLLEVPKIISNIYKRLSNKLFLIINKFKKSKASSIDIIKNKDIED